MLEWLSLLVGILDLALKAYSLISEAKKQKSDNRGSGSDSKE
jgi:hypothetical protein